MFRNCFLLFCCIAVLFAQVQLPAQDEKNVQAHKHTGKHILVLLSYHSTYPWTGALLSGIKDRLARTSYKIDYNIVELDTMRNHDKSVWNRKLQLLMPWIERGYYDVIVTIDDRALDLLLENAGRIPRNTPIIFTGYEKDTSGLRKKHANITGVKQRYDLAATIKSGLAFYPATKEVLILTDKADDKDVFAASLRRALPALEGRRITILESSKYDISEILSEISSLQRESIVVILRWTNLKKGSSTIFDRLERITEKIQR